MFLVGVKKTGVAPNNRSHTFVSWNNEKTED